MSAPAGCATQSYEVFTFDGPGVGLAMYNTDESIFGFAKVRRRGRGAAEPRARGAGGGGGPHQRRTPPALSKRLGGERDIQGPALSPGSLLLVAL